MPSTSTSSCPAFIESRTFTVVGATAVTTGLAGGDGDLVAFPHGLGYDFRRATAALLRVLALAAVQLVHGLLFTTLRGARHRKRGCILSDGALLSAQIAAATTATAAAVHRRHRHPELHRPLEAHPQRALQRELLAPDPPIPTYL